MKSSVLCLVFLFGCGDDSGDGGDADSDSDTDTEPPCDPSQTQYADELVPEEIARMPGDALAIGTDWTTAVVCGKDFALGVDLASGGMGAAVPLTSPCTGATVEGGHAVVVDREGTLVLYAVGAGGALAELDRDQNLVSRYEGVLLDGGVADVAAGSSGILRFDTAGDVLTAVTAWTGATDARDIVKDGDGFAVADGEGGVRLLAADGSVTETIELPVLTTAIELEDVLLPYLAETIAVSDSWILAGSNAYGYVWRARSGGDPVANARPYFNEGPVLDLAMDHDGGFLYAEGGSIRRMQFDETGAVSRLASEYRTDPRDVQGGWWIGVEARDGEALLLQTDALFHVDLPAHVVAPDLNIVRQSLLLENEPGNAASAAMLFKNYGDAPLALLVDSMTPDTMTAYFLDLAGIDVPNADGCLPIPPGGPGGSVQIDYVVGTEPEEGVLTIVGNDPDEGTLAFPVHGNRAELAVGDVAPDFDLTTIDGTTYRLSDHAGEVVLLMFFNST